MSGCGVVSRPAEKKEEEDKKNNTVEERRTTRDGQGNEETTVTRSGGSRVLEGPEYQTEPVVPGAPHRFSDMQDDDSLFSKFFGGFK